MELKKNKKKMRKKKIKKKIYNPDIKYNSKLVTYFINHIMKNGKKYLAYKIFYTTLNIIKKKFENKKKLPLEILKESIKNISPDVEVKSKKIGGTTYNIPVHVNEKKKKYLSIKWLIYFSKKRKGKNMSEKLANEIISAYRGIGETIKKKNELHKIAESNKAFSHFKF